MSSITETLVESAPPKVKKTKKPHKVNSEETPQEVAAETTSSPPPSGKKRKREALPDEIEVDVAAPEPPSKKALRRLKKGKPALPTATSLSNAAIQAEDDSDLDDTTTKKTAGPGDGKRSEYGVWIGNLPFAANPVSLREFLTAGDISHASITRIHMPVPHNASSTRTQVKPQNKGFAYVDFTTKAAMDAAVALSETALGGRKVLIKDARSYAGRPEKSKTDEAGQTTTSAATGRTKAALEGVVGTPSKRVFVGNLDFAVTKEDLQELFSKCGTIEDVHMATFEDTGKCKGYAWIRFVEIEAAEAAVRGWLRVAEPGDSDDEESASDEAKSEAEADDAIANDSDAAEKKKQKKPKKAKKPRTRKWFVNRLLGRALRCEFAEDASTRYRKRFGKDAASARENDRDAAAIPDTQEVNDGPIQNPRKMGKKPGRGPARDIQPGAPTDPGRRRGRTGEDVPQREPNVGSAETRYRTGAIAEATGQKKTFD